MIELTKDNFEEEVLNSEGYVMVDFWGPSCEPCLALMPHVKEFEKTYGDKIKFTSLDVSKARRLAMGQKVMGLPVIAIYKDGERIDGVVGEDATADAVEELLKKYQ